MLMGTRSQNVCFCLKSRWQQALYASLPNVWIFILKYGKKKTTAMQLQLLFPLCLPQNELCCSDFYIYALLHESTCFSVYLCASQQS